jgi:two-component system response regulator HydG
VLEDFERRYLTRILNKHNGNISRAAEQSGIDRRSMHRLMVKYRISARKMKQSV